MALQFVTKGPINDNSNITNGFAPKKRQGIIWTNDDLVYLRIYAPRSIN